MAGITPAKAGPDPQPLSSGAPSLAVLGQLRHRLRVLKEIQFAASPFSSRNCGDTASSRVRGCLLPTELGAQEPNARHREHNVTSGESRKASQALLAPPSSLEGKKIPEGAKGVKINECPW